VWMQLIRLKSCLVHYHILPQLLPNFAKSTVKKLLTTPLAKCREKMIL
jgi:hypothetical protein